MDSEIRHHLNNALTVEELIEELRMFPMDTKVVFGDDYGDRCHTEQALPVETVEALYASENSLYITAYSSSKVGIDLEKPSADLSSGHNPLVIVLR